MKQNDHYRNSMAWIVGGMMVAAVAAHAAIGVKVGDEAPGFTLKQADGKASVSLNQWKGKNPVFVNIFNTWCGPCIKETPDMVKLYETYAKKGLQIVSICTPWSKDSAEKAAAFKEKYHMNWPVVFDQDGTVTKQYQVQGVPTNCLVDKNGKVLFYHAASLSEEMLTTLFDAALAGTVPHIQELEDQARQQAEYAKAEEAKRLAAMEGKPFIGVTIGDAKSDEEGAAAPKAVIVQSLIKGGPAEAAGLQVGDRITTINKKPVEGTELFIGTLRAHQPGDIVELNVTREGKSSTVKIKVGKFSAKALQP